MALRLVGLALTLLSHLSEKPALVLPCIPANFAPECTCLGVGWCQLSTLWALIIVVHRAI